MGQIMSDTGRYPCLVWLIARYMYVRAFFFAASTPVAAGHLWGERLRREGVTVFLFRELQKIAILSKCGNYSLLSSPASWIRENNRNSKDSRRVRVTILSSRCLKFGMPRIFHSSPVGNWVIHYSTKTI